MDTSEKYIKMCEAAQEIQAQWKPEESDVIYSLHSAKTMFVCADSRNWTYYKKIKEYQTMNGDKETYVHRWYGAVWLPRQDQLQKMAWPTDIIIHASDMIFTFNSFCRDYNNWKTYDTMEQLWLGYLMERGCEKTWLDNQWQTKRSVANENSTN